MIQHCGETFAMLFYFVISIVTSFGENAIIFISYFRRKQVYVMKQNQTLSSAVYVTSSDESPT